MSKITINEKGECLDISCPFRRECAQFFEADTFTKSEGFAPEIDGFNRTEQWAECSTRNSDPDPFDCDFPKEVKKLDYGFVKF